MDRETFEFEISDNKVYIYGHPELEGRCAALAGDGMVFFRGTGWRDYELFVANTLTGKIRKLATTGGRLLVDDGEIDYESIVRGCEHGIANARSKTIRYSSLGTCGGFRDGLCVISWMLYPDGEYFADSDGFGMQDNYEENVYAIMDIDLNFVEPFRPVDDVAAYIGKAREKLSDVTPQLFQSL